MSVTIHLEDIVIEDRRAAIEEAVREAFGARPGDWEVWIHEPRYDPRYIITISGPNEFKWEQNFFGPIQQSPDNIREEIVRALAKHA